MRSLTEFSAQARRQIGQALAGGAWSARLDAVTQRNLRWFSVNGLFAQVTDSIALTYVALFVLSLGASSAEIGWMTALSSLSAALLLLPAGVLAERRDRRLFICLSLGGAARFILLLLALAPLVFRGPALVAVAIGLVVVREALANMPLPAWTALTADLVPLAWRGRYFGARNFAMGLAGIVTTLAAGVLIAQWGGTLGYQLALGVAALAGLFTILSFARLQPPASAAAEGAAVPAVRWRQLLAPAPFWAFAGTAFLWNFALNLAGPFFTVYVIEGLKGDAGAVGLLTATTALSSLPGLRVFGALSDRWGPRRVQLLTGLLIPGLPFAWLLATSPYHPALINIAGGFLWAGFQLASFNLLLDITPEALRPRYTAIYQMVVMGALAAGAAAGGALITNWGYHAVFLLSGLGRIVAMLLFARYVRTPR